MAKFTRRISGGSRKNHKGKKTRHAKKHRKKGRRGGDLGTKVLPFALMGAKHAYGRARGNKKLKGGFARSDQAMGRMTVENLGTKLALHALGTVGGLSSADIVNKTILKTAQDKHKDRIITGGRRTRKRGRGKRSKKLTKKRRNRKSRY